jgi:uncharacterized membrane protein YhiD involved in acid resistance
MPSDLELLGRLLIAALLGGAIGAERELNDQAAGLRTHMLLTIGACLFTVISAYGFRRAPATRCSGSAGPGWWWAPWSGCAG